jgi:hypothetical protein
MDGYKVMASLIDAGTIPGTCEKHTFGVTINVISSSGGCRSAGLMGYTREEALALTIAVNEKNVVSEENKQN